MVRSYAVHVCQVDAATLAPSRTAPNPRGMTWALMSNLNRLSSQVAKELVVCHVLLPPLTAQEWDSPACLSELKAQLVLMRRWIPEKTRYNVNSDKGKLPSETETVAMET